MRTIKRLVIGLVWALAFPIRLIIVKRKYVEFSPICWEKEKKDIIGRANWLCDKVIVSPRNLLRNMPSILGKYYAGQWAIYSCSMLTAALYNISRIYPEEKEQNIQRIERLIDIVLSPELREYDTNAWKEDALLSLSGKKSHMTYLSILSWMILNYKKAGGGSRHDKLLHSCCEAMHRRMLMSDDLNLLSFPRTPIFLPDMLVAIVALKQYCILYDGKYSTTVDAWLNKAKTISRHKSTGLLKSKLPTKKNTKRRTLRGSYSALNCYYLSLIDPEFAESQYYSLVKAFYSDDSEDIFGGIHEYLQKRPRFKLDVDAGPIVFGLSASGTAFAIGAATFFNDWKTRSKLLHTAEIAGQTVKRKHTRHYRLGELVIVGEATTLAMRTNINKDSQ